MRKLLASLLAIGGLGGLVGWMNYADLVHARHRAIAKNLDSLGSVWADLSRPPLTVKAVGDIMLASTYPNTSRMPPADGATVLAEVRETLAAADLTFGNLEGPLIDGGVSAKCGPNSTRCFAFRTPTRYAQYLKESGFDVLSLANNHVGDFGAAGRESTRKALEDVGIRHAGSGTEELAETIVAVKGSKVGFLALGHNPGMLSVTDVETAVARVKALDEQVDIVVVSYHGGAEGSDRGLVPNQDEIFLGENRGNLPKLSKAVIDAGADLVLGHGPHILRGLEIYNDRLIVYSLGNFATYGWFQLAGSTALSGILEVELAPDGSFRSGEFTSYKLINRGIPVPDETRAALREVRSLSTRNFRENAPKFGENGEISLPVKP